MTHYVDLSPHDEAHLDWARRLAQKGWGQVHPNPMVGCVLVLDGRVVGEGYHEVFGGPHAEIVALERALTHAEGATAYVSLEPCNHYGKTPPCAQALLDAGVSRVVFGASDPGADSRGGGAMMRAAGVEVVGPVWSNSLARAENPAFHHSAHHETPFVAVKLAMTLDAKIASSPGVPTRISGVEAEREVHRLRSGFDAVMVGAGTAAADDPRLTVRMVASGVRPPRRIVLSSEARLDPAASLFEDLESAPLHVFCRDDAPETAMARLEGAGAHVHPVVGSESGLALDAVLGVCSDLGIQSIVCEGGARLAQHLLEEGRVQRLYLFLSPHTIGEGGVEAFGSGAGRLDWTAFEPAGPTERFGRDTLLVLDRQEA